jgi:type VI secretion system protein ImpM
MVFWRAKKSHPPVVSCFGKLTATGDFIRLNAATPENQAFDQWFAGGINFAKESLGDHFGEYYTPSVGLFIYRGDCAGGNEPDRGLIGVWAASGDSAGRRYPMTVMTAYDYEQMLAVGPALPIAVWPFLTSAYDLVTNGRHLAADDFVTRVAQIQPMALDNPESAASAYHGWIEHQSMSAFWLSAYGSTDWRYHVMMNFQASLNNFVGDERPQTNLALRFPLGSGDAYAAAVWMDMATRLGKWERTVSNAFWSPQRDLTLHVGPPHVATFRELIASSEGGAEHVMDLLQPPSLDQTAARERLVPRLREAVDNLDQSIASFLRSL